MFIILIYSKLLILVIFFTWTPFSSWTCPSWYLWGTQKGSRLRRWVECSAKFRLFEFSISFSRSFPKTHLLFSLVRFLVDRRFWSRLFGGGNFSLTLVGRFGLFGEDRQGRRRRRWGRNICNWGDREVLNCPFYKTLFTEITLHPKTDLLRSIRAVWRGDAFSLVFRRNQRRIHRPVERRLKYRGLR